MQIILSLQSLYPKRVCLEQLLCVCARVCVHTITCVSMLFLWVLNFLMSIQQSIAFSLVFWLDRVLCYPPNRPHASSIVQTPRLLIDIMIFHLNLPQTILEHYSNTAKVFPFQSKRKKKKIPYVFHNLYIAFPHLSLLMFWLHFLLLSVYITPLLQPH